MAEQAGKTLEVPTQIAVQIKVMEFDKLIAEAEAQAATLKAQRAQFIYDSNLKMIQHQYQKPAAVPAT